MRTKANVVVLAAALGVLLAVGVVAADDTDLESRIAAAETAADHEALAADYSTEAAAARHQAERHVRMGDRYKRGGKAPHMESHCKRLAENYRQNAKELDALAAAHRKMAADAGK